jgi:hypothetical protein
MSEPQVLDNFPREINSGLLQSCENKSLRPLVGAPELVPIVDSATNALFAAEIPFGSLHRSISEQELDLLQLTSCRVAELCARAPIMPHAA